MVLSWRRRPMVEGDGSGRPTYQDKWTVTRMLLRRSQKPGDESKKGVPSGREKIFRKQSRQKPRQIQPQVFVGESPRQQPMDVPPSPTSTACSTYLDDSVKEAATSQVQTVKLPVKDAPAPLSLSNKFEEKMRQAVPVQKTSAKEARTIPQIATIADLAPKILNKPQLATNPRRRSTALPEWWKEEKEKRSRTSQRALPAKEVAATSMTSSAQEFRDDTPMESSTNVRDKVPAACTQAPMPKPVPAETEFREEEVVLQREDTRELRSVPPIATIAELGPKIMGDLKLCTPAKPNSRRRSSTALPNWWKQCVRQEDPIRRATWHGASQQAAFLRNRRSLMMDNASASLHSGVYAVPRRISEFARQSSFAGSDSTSGSSPQEPSNESSPEPILKEFLPKQVDFRKRSEPDDAKLDSPPQVKANVVLPGTISELSDMPSSQPTIPCVRGKRLGGMLPALLAGVFVAVACRLLLEELLSQVEALQLILF